MLLVIGERDRERFPAIEGVTVAVEHPRLVYEETLVGIGTDEAVESGGEHGPALADVVGVGARMQADEVVASRACHVMQPPHRPALYRQGASTQARCARRSRPGRYRSRRKWLSTRAPTA